MRDGQTETDDPEIDGADGPGARADRETAAREYWRRLAALEAGQRGLELAVFAIMVAAIESGTTKPAIRSSLDGAAAHRRARGDGQAADVLDRLAAAVTTLDLPTAAAARPGTRP